MMITRRRFVQSAIATSAACGIIRFARADQSVANPADSGSIVDTHIYIGDWPHKAVPNTSAKELAATLRSSNVSQGWVGSFDGLFHKDVGGVNKRLADQCREHGAGGLIPFGTVNLTLPDWKEDVRRCHEDHRMPGIRLHPQYHGYTLSDPRFASLLTLAASRGIVVQLVAWIEDQKHRWLSPEHAEVDLKPLGSILTQLSNLKLVIANCSTSSGAANFGSASTQNHAYYDFARLKSNSALRKLVTQRSAERFVFGSGAPLNDSAQPRLVFASAELNADELHSIGTRNAGKLVDLASTVSVSERR